MFMIPTGGGCCSGAKRRTALVISAIAAASGGIAVSLFDHKHDGDGAAAGDASAWHVPAIAIGAVVIVTALVLLLVRWKRGEEEEG